jgi:DNA-binding beta-propeller fold protein YncE
MFGKIRLFALTGALVASSFVASDAQAAGWILGLVDGKSIVTIDPATRKVMSKVDIKGAGPLIGIDVRPADGMLYGVASDGTIVTVDAKSGQAAMKGKMSETLKSGVSASVDFNPVA